MTGDTGLVPTPAGPVRLRAETAEDAPFLAGLFAARAAAVLRAAGLAQAQVAQLVAMQHQAQTGSYRAAFPGARFLIVEQDGTPVGRLVEDDEPGGVHVVDIALLPERQGRGIGAALIADLQRRQAERGGYVRAQAAADNARSRAMFARLGFTATQPPAAIDLELTWPPGREGCAPARR